MMARPMQTYSTMVGWHAPFYENTFLVQNQLIVDDNHNFLFYRLSTSLRLFVSRTREKPPRLENLHSTPPFNKGQVY